MRLSRRTCPYALVEVLASNVILLIVTITSSYVQYARARKYERVVGARYPLDLPDMLVTVEDTEKYPIYGSQANLEWTATTTATRGFVQVGDDKRRLALAFGHELHCLRALRVAIAYPWHPIANTAHTSHCLNYLRMYILCNSDLTLEMFDPLEANFTAGRSGATHVCRDWRFIYEELSSLKGEQ